MAEYVELVNLLVVSGVALLSAAAGFLVALARAAGKVNKETAEALESAAKHLEATAEAGEKFRKG
jgi:hypothetical protein